MDEEIVQLTPAEFVETTWLLEKAGVAPRGEHAKVKKNYPDGYNGEVASIGITSERWKEASAFRKKWSDRARNREH